MEGKVAEWNLKGHAVKSHPSLDRYNSRIRGHEPSNTQGWRNGRMSEDEKETLTLSLTSVLAEEAAPSSTYSRYRQYSSARARCTRRRREADTAFAREVQPCGSVFGAL